MAAKRVWVLRMEDTTEGGSTTFRVVRASSMDGYRMWVQHDAEVCGLALKCGGAGSRDYEALTVATGKGQFDEADQLQWPVAAATGSSPPLPSSLTAPPATVSWSSPSVPDSGPRWKPSTSRNSDEGSYLTRDEALARCPWPTTGT